MDQRDFCPEVASRCAAERDNTVAIYPVCPHCKASALEGRTFLATEVFDEELRPYKRGEIMKSALHLVCDCGETFPLWTYVKGDPDSQAYNAVGDDGQPRKEPESQPWWTSATPGLIQELRAAA